MKRNISSYVKVLVYIQLFHPLIFRYSLCYETSDLTSNLPLNVSKLRSQPEDYDIDIIFYLMLTLNKITGSFSESFPSFSKQFDWKQRTITTTNRLCDVFSLSEVRDTI